MPSGPIDSHLLAEINLHLWALATTTPTTPLHPDYPLFPQFFVIVCNALQQASICVNYW